MLSCRLCKNKETDFFCRIDHYQYFRCHICQTLFIHPQPSTKNIDNYYKKKFAFDAGRSNEKRTRQQAIKIINNLKRLNPKGKTLLDIGSGYGYFLDEANRQRLNFSGIEPSKKLYKFSSIKHLIKVFNTDFDRYFRENKSSKFDFITLNHLIEHIKNPQDVIAKVSTLLNKNGCLYIETPNLDSHLFRAEKENYTFLTPPQHLWLFSLKSFRYLISRIPSLKIIKSSTYSYPEHLMGIIKKTSNIKYQMAKTENSNVQKFNNLKFKNFKFAVFDRLIAPILAPTLNLGGYGSILELYIAKK